MAQIPIDPLDDLYAKGTLVRPIQSAYEIEQRATELAGRSMNPLEIMSAAFKGGANTAVNMYNDFERKTAAGAPDPKWNPAEWLDANKDRVPISQQSRWMSTGNQQEAELLLQDYNESAYENEKLAATGGFTSFTAQALAGLVDIDAPLALLSGGTSAGIKAGFLSTKIGRMAVGVAAGSLTGAGLMTLDYGVNPNSDWTSIPVAALLGASFGMLGSAVAPHANAMNRVVQDEFEQSLEHGVPLSKEGVHKSVFNDENPYVTPDAPSAKVRAPVAVTIEPAAVHADGAGSTVGAAQIGVPDWQARVGNPAMIDTIASATARVRALGIGKTFDQAWDRVESAAPGVAHAARTFEKVVQASPLASVYDRLMTSPSYVAKAAAYDLFASAHGILTNAKAAAVVREMYDRQLRGTGIPIYTASYDAWSAAQGHGRLSRQWSRATKQAFDEQVALELQSRRFGGAPTQDLHVRNAADANDAFSKLELEINTGRPGEGSVKGWDKIKWEPGYMPQRWSGVKMMKLIRDGATTEAQLVKQLQRGYLKEHPGMLPADATLYAQAVITRALTTARGVNTNLIGILQEDGREFLREALKRNGLGETDIANLIDRLTERSEFKSQQGQTKHRIDVDLREVHPDTGVRLLDIIDTDLMDSMGRRARGTSGRAALARKGIYSVQDRDHIIDTILKEQGARKTAKVQSEGVADKIGDILHDPKDLTQDELRDMFSHFTEGAPGGGVSPWVSRAIKLTNLSVLNGLGLTQMAESGVMIAAFGWEKFSHFAGDSLMASLGKGDSELVAELTHLNIMVPEHQLFRPDMNFDTEKGPLQSELLATIDHTLNQLQRAQGMLTGFHKIMEFQQRIAVTAGADKIMTALAGHSKDISPDRLAEMGMSPDLVARVKKYIDNGTVEFKAPDGSAVFNEKSMFLRKLNLEKWDPKDMDEFTGVLNIIMNRQVQKALAGETSMVFHKDGIIALFTHLKTFPLLAMSKQTLRHLRVADPESVATLMYGLMTAGAVYSAKQALNGNADQLDAIKVMKGAFGMSNLTGWIPMFSDPVAAMLGMDNLKFNEYSRGIDGNIIGMPASFSTLSKMANIPAAVASPVTGALGLGKGVWNDNDINALKAFPILGNYYGVGALLNLIKDARRPAQQVAAKPKAENAPTVPPLPATIQSLIH